MKKILFTFLIISLFVPEIAIGQSANEETEASNSSIDKIDQIKDKVTTQVEKLDLVEKRGLVGVVEEIKDNQIRLNDLNDKIRIVEVDELTKYSSEENNSFDLNSIEAGIKISVIGLYNKDSEKLLARFLNEISIPVYLNGVISEVNEDEFTVTVATEDENNYTVDIENVTKTYSFSEEELEQSGFTELEVLQNAIITGFSNPDEENRISATRIIVFPNIPKNPRIQVEVPEPSGEELSPTP